ncbi:MAG TPA: S41 family peptidase [Thermoanaerobaculia bacterium]|nr:S41 family peptidase [Thermoanaerobaculia bacterium]
MTKKKIVLLALSVALLLSLIAGALFGQATPKGSIFRYLNIFSEVLDLVRGNYVESVATDQLLDGAFAGVTDALDEFSYYVPPSQMAAHKKINSDLEDNGVGLVVTKRFGYAFIVSVVPESPAAKAGLERADLIEKIDGQLAQKLALWQVSDRLRSSRPVTLSILRGGRVKRDEITIRPAAYHPIAIKTDQIGAVAYIAIPFFEKGTSEEFRAALDEVRKKGLRKLIVDLRSNAGGNVEEAIASADHLLTSGLITSLHGRKVEKKQWQADRATAYDGDVQVLVDNSSAAGAEIFAGAIRGNARGKIVGVSTFGKSIVQRFISLPSGGGVQMTIGHYTTPDSKPIKEAGVKPDVTVDLSAQSIREPDGSRALPREDVILEKALGLFGETSQPVPVKKAA